MAAGDLITGDGQVEIRGVLTGDTTVYQRGGQIGGLGVPAPKTHDTPLGHAPGAYFGRDYTDVRILTVPYAIEGTPAAAGALFVALSALWASSETDIPLHLQVPGFGHFAVNGRPRGLVDDLSDLSIGLVRALATFHCGDPTLLYPAAAPTIGAAAAGAYSLTVAWTPATTGGVPYGYEIDVYRVSDGVLVGSGSTGAGTTSGTVTGLTTGEAVHAKVIGFTSSFGAGPPSGFSNTVTPTGAATVPSAPRSPVATAGPSTAQMTCTWVAPLSNGGSAITGYALAVLKTSDNSSLANFTLGTGLSTTVTLTSGVPSYFKVAAINAVGTGAQSVASNSATPP